MKKSAISEAYGQKATLPTRGERGGEENVVFNIHLVTHNLTILAISTTTTTMSQQRKRKAIIRKSIIIIESNYDKNTKPTNKQPNKTRNNITRG